MCNQLLLAALHLVKLGYSFKNNILANSNVQ